MYVLFEKKINIDQPTIWDFHRSGWKFVIQNLKKVHSSLGIKFISHFESNVALNNTINEPWIGFLHNTPFHCEDMKIYSNFNLSLDNISKSRVWLDSKKNCKGLFVLSNYVKKWIKKNMFDNVEFLYHPTEIPEIKFDPNLFFSKNIKNLLFIGHWMRKFESFENINCKNYKKIMLLTPFYYKKKQKEIIYKKFISNYNYDILLSKSLVFLDLHDSSANNLIIECIVRNSPILVRKLEAVEEYLGKDYPMYFSDLKEAEEKMQNEAIINHAYEYLLKKDKSYLTAEKFIENFLNSSIYRNL